MWKEETLPFTYVFLNCRLAAFVISNNRKPPDLGVNTPLQMLVLSF